MFEFGDRFVSEDSTEWMLVDLGKNRINLVDLKSGKLFTVWDVYVNDSKNITHRDMERLLGDSFDCFKWAK